MIHELQNENTILNHYLVEIRDQTIQQDSLRFRENMNRIAQIIGYEISKKLDYTSAPIETVLAATKGMTLKHQPVVASILRAGLAMHQGLINVFDQCENAYISAYREESSESSEVKVNVEYLASPDLNGKTIILADPMLATGTSLLLAYEALLTKGQPEKIHIASIIASKHAVELLEQKFPSNTEFWIAAIDPELNSKAYIVPGLGDAGDLAFGPKI